MSHYINATATYVWVRKEQSEDNEADDAKAGGPKM